jgi:MFS family permease
MIAEKLLGQDLAAAAIAIDAAQIKGVLPLPLSSLRSTLPVFRNPANKHLAGTIGDLVERRRFLLVTQTLMLAAAAALGGLAIAGLVTPWVLLALLFAVGTGQALTSPTG